jgi:hypothetical protein
MKRGWKYRIFMTKKGAERTIARQRPKEPDLKAFSALPHPDQRYTGWVVHASKDGVCYALAKSKWIRLSD